ncbi:MAG: Hpt domain-containing protein [Kordiimonadaceae bacterium]|nr:Hpt domain-containing protein [Kordiimonadaceae bacterium]
MEQCKTDIEDALALVKVGIETNDTAPIERGTHKLKSISGTFGLADLCEVSIRVSIATQAAVPYANIEPQAFETLSVGKRSIETLQAYIAEIV